MKIETYLTEKLIKKYLGKNDRKIAEAISQLYDIYRRRGGIEEQYKK